MVNLIEASRNRPHKLLHFYGFQLVSPQWPKTGLSKGLVMSSRVCVIGHLKDPVPFVKQSRALCPGSRFPPSFIHQVIIITGLNNVCDCMFSDFSP